MGTGRRAVLVLSLAALLTVSSAAHAIHVTITTPCMPCFVKSTTPGTWECQVTDAGDVDYYYVTWTWFDVPDMQGGVALTSVQHAMAKAGS